MFEAFETVAPELYVELVTKLYQVRSFGRVFPTGLLIAAFAFMQGLFNEYVLCHSCDFESSRVGWLRLVILLLA
jgi:hypothetical protein